MTGLFHGTWWNQHQDHKLGDLMAGRFTRLLAEDTDPVDGRELQRLAGKMTSDQEEPGPTPEDEPDAEEDSQITAAYTYLGQFTDHDLTFDPTSRLREALDPERLKALADFRTPRFDLDNLYGRGPDDQPYLYDKDRIHMLLGEPMSGNPFDPEARQIPRGPNGRALIGDPRNDENRIVAQLHAIFLRFHNQVADHLGQQKEEVTFDKVRNLVRWHYQWMLVTDYLPAVVNKMTYDSIFAGRYDPTPRLPGLQNGRLQLMPVEFSVAAFRFGHSMIRPVYRLNTTIERRPIFAPDRGAGAPADDAADLGGFRPIPADWAIDWQFYIDLGPGAGPRAMGPLYDPIAREPQHAYKIDTSLASPLRHLPSRIASDPSILALRNLERGRVFQLRSGQAVAKALGEPVIGDDRLVIGKATAQDQDKHEPIAQIAPSFAGRAPLWAYILSEAQVTSWGDPGPGESLDKIPIKLGPVGGRIVAGVFAALLRGDPTSYLNTDHLREGARFEPIADFTRGEKFGLAELINVALWPTQTAP